MRHVLLQLLIAFVAAQAPQGEGAPTHERLFHQAELAVARNEQQLADASARSTALADQFAKAQADLAAARDAYRHDAIVYHRDGNGVEATAGETPPSEAEVARRIDELDGATRFVARFAADRELHATASEARGELDALGDRTDEADRLLTRRSADARAAFVELRRKEAPAQDADAQWKSDWEPRWNGLRTRSEQTFAALRRTLAATIATAEQLGDEREQLEEWRGRTLALLRSENLFLQGSTRISRAALERGVADLVRLPGWLLTQFQRLPKWLAEDGNLRALVTFLASLLPLALASWLARRFTARRFAQLETMDTQSMPVRATLMLAHLVSVACAAAFFWLAPLLAKVLIPGLAAGAGDLASSLGSIAALCWIGLGVNRELLRPRPPQRSVLDVDPATARRVGAGVKVLLAWSLVVLSLQQLLTRLAYDNAGALEAIDLIYWVGTGAIVMVVLLRRGLLMSLLPAADRPLGRFLHRSAGLLHTTFVLLVPTVVVLQALRFRILAGFVTRLAILVLAAFPLGSILYHSVAFFLDRWRTRAATRAGDDDVERRRIAALDSIARFLLRVAVVVLVVAAVFATTGNSYASLRTFLDRPLPLLHPGAGEPPVTWWNVALALFIAFAFFRCARHLRLALEAVILPRTRLAHATQYTITFLADYLMIGLGLWIAVNQVVDVKSLGYLVAALSVGIGFGLQEIISNFVSGLILIFERPIKPGDLVQLDGGTIGTVRELGIRATTVRTNDNVHVLVPNREFITQKVVNYHLLDPTLRVAIDVGVAYGSDPKRVRDALLEVAGKDGRVLRRPAPEVMFTDFGDSALAFRLLVWIEDALQQWRVASDLRFAIDAAFKRNAIEIPFPQRDVTFKRGGALRVVVERDGAPKTAPPTSPAADAAAAPAP